MIRAEPEMFEKELIHLFIILSKEKEASKRIEIFYDMVKYIFSVRKDAKRFHHKEIYIPLEAEYMTYLEELEAEYELRGLEKGFQKGIEKGIQKGKLETARNLQAEGFELSLIKKITGLTEEEIRGEGI